MTMSAQEPLSAEAFAIERLREDPNLDYGTLRQLAADAGLTMAPILYGRARRALGLPPLSGARPAPVAAPRAEAPTAPAAVSKPPAPASPPAGTMRRSASPAFEFVVEQLRREPEIVYGELHQRAARAGHKIAPIMFGRAKALLGLVAVKPRGASKRAKAAAPVAAEAAPRQLKQVESVAADRFSKQLAEAKNIDQLVQVVRDLDVERRRLRALLERVVDMIDEALG